MARPLRLVVYDQTDVAPLSLPRIERASDGTAHGTGGLSRWWRVGAAMHRGVLRADGTRGVSSFAEALEWATSIARQRGAKLGELQVWGHGGWGQMTLGRTRLDRDALARSSEISAALDALRDVLADDALLWLRCCSAFGEREGRAFGAALADRVRARVAGHTFIIGVFQSGTHSIAPGQEPTWDPEEGIERGAAGLACAMTSTPKAPNTIGCLRLGFPGGW